MIPFWSHVTSSPRKAIIKRYQKVLQHFGMVMIHHCVYVKISSILFFTRSQWAYKPESLWLRSHQEAKKNSTIGLNDNPQSYEKPNPPGPTIFTGPSLCRLGSTICIPNVKDLVPWDMVQGTHGDPWLTVLRIIRMILPQKNERIYIDSKKRDHVKRKWIIWSKHQCSGDMFVFRGVHFLRLTECPWK